MKSGRLLFPLLLSAGVVVTLGLVYVASPAQSLLPVPAAAASEEAPTPAAAGVSPPAATASPGQTDAAPAQPAEPPAQADAPAAPIAAKLTQAELDQLLAPIALYPDQLLSQILMASTYPLEIVEAARWVKDPAHRRLKGDALTNALREQHWDPSVMALVPFPHLLQLMDSQIAWTQKLGAAFVAQQGDCMNEVQRLRQQAIAAGNLKSGPQCRCLVAQRSGYVTVAPANPQIVYAPVYDSGVIYGPWPYPAYPPFLFPLPVGFAFAPGFFIGYGVGVDVAYYGPLWGWGNINWGGRNIIVNSVTFNTLSGGHTAFAGNVWIHDSTRASSIVAARAISAHAVASRGLAGAAADSAVVHTPSSGHGGAHASFAGHGSAGHGGSHASFAGHGGSHASFAGHGSSHASFARHGGSRGSIAGHLGSRGGGGGFGSSAPAHAMMHAGGGGGHGGGGGGHGGGGGGHGGGGGNHH